MRGFSLVELIVTLALLSILAIGSSRFLLDATDGYTATNERIQLAGYGATVLELSHRALSSALPLSTRITADGKCVEWLPVVEGGRYEGAPVGHASSSFGVLGGRSGGSCQTPSPQAPAGRFANFLPVNGESPARLHPGLRKY